MLFPSLQRANEVALFVSAWIEISPALFGACGQIVALFVSAWIEILSQTARRTNAFVALFVSAWIEIQVFIRFYFGIDVALLTSGLSK